jgi:hypothetical protein
MKTHDIVARYYASTDSMQYFIEDEIIHLTKYYPHPLYGTPPSFKLRMNVFAYLYIEARIKMYYEKGRPPGLVSVQTDNPAAVEENIKKLNETFKTDPMSIPWFPVSNSSGSRGKAVEFVPFMQDPSEAMMAVKHECRRAICSFFNVSPIFESDVEGSKGLANAGHQITILSRGIEYGQKPWNNKFFPWFTRKLHIYDWNRRLNKAEQADEKDAAELQLLQDQHAMNLQTMGFDIWKHDGQYKSSDRPTEEGIARQMNAGMNLPIPQASMGKPGQNEQAGKESGPSDA